MGKITELLAKFEQKVTVAGKSQSTLSNYSRHLAKLALHFNELPKEVDPYRVNNYFHFVKRRHNSTSDSYFKFTVYALRFAYRIEGIKEKRIELPSIKHSKKFLVVLSHEEVWRLHKAPNLLKHRVFIGLLYDCGLRCFEVRNLKIANLDFDRKVLHVKDGKGKKERYVPFADILIQGLKVNQKVAQWRLDYPCCLYRFIQKDASNPGVDGTGNHPEKAGVALGMIQQLYELEKNL